jgi:Flp pilus assembly protein TadG
VKRRHLLKDERGQTIVLFSVLLPLILLLTSIAWDAGNWWIHRRHLQTQADAAVLATVNDFSTCFIDENAANKGIIYDALRYAGDTTRAAVLVPATTTTNTQIEGDSRVHVVLNSSVYWDSSNSTALSPNGDYQAVPDETQHYNASPDGTPCGSSTIEAKITDDRVNPLVPWLPLRGLSPYPSPKRNARVEIQQEDEAQGMLPIAVPETDPAAIYAIFVDYAKDGTQTGTCSGPSFCVQQLMKDPSTYGANCGGTSLNPFPYQCWFTSSPQGAVPIQTNGASEGTGVVILVSKQDNNLSFAGKTLNQICVQNNLIACYAGTGGAGNAPVGYDGTQTGQGISFIHSYRDSNGTPCKAGDGAGCVGNGPLLRDVNVAPIGCSSPGDLSAAYFTNDANDCNATVTVKVDFGVSGDPTKKPAQGGICAQLTSNYGALQWQSSSGTISTWVPTNWTIPLPFDSGAAAKLRLTWQDVTDNPNDPGLKNNCNTNGNPPPNIAHGPTDFPYPAAVPYVSDDNAGPVEYLKLSASGPYASAQNCVTYAGVADANSVSGGGNTPWYCYGVGVGVNRAITLTDPNNPGAPRWDVPDILLRTASKAARQSGNDQTALNGALDCDAGIKLDVEFQNGCQTFYGLNYKAWGTPTCPSAGVKCWKDISCSEYGPNDLPPNVQPDPAPICVAPKGGTVADLEHGLFLRFENPCSENWWPTTAAQATDGRFDPSSPNYHDWAADPRYVKLIITDESAFSHPNLNEPVKYFAGFYVTGWDVTSGNGQNKPHGCYGFQPNPNTCGAPNNDSHPLYGCPTNPQYPTNRDNGDIWGHWLKIVDPPSLAKSSGEKCNLIDATDPSTCVAVLTE